MLNKFTSKKGFNSEVDFEKCVPLIIGNPAICDFDNRSLRGLIDFEVAHFQSDPFSKLVIF